MRICLITRNRFHGDRKAVSAYQALTRAGHEVEIVAIDTHPPLPPVSRTVSRRPRPANRLSGLLARVVPSTVSDRMLQDRLARAVHSTDAKLFIPLHEDVLPAAMAAASTSSGTVLRSPRMPGAGDVDLIDLAPRHPGLAEPMGGHGPMFTSGTDTPAPEPTPGRHEGQRVVVCYRKTASNPGRYLEAALVRAGFEVVVETEAIDLGAVAEDTAFVIFVESPYPALEVTGSTDVPVLFWVHHGEHHLRANLRLAERYRADAVLLAHSWHLAFWFPGPVHRFPFGVAPELSSPDISLGDRRFDVVMVGSKLRSDAWQYRRRRALVEELEKHLPHERVAFVEGVTPEEMGRIYADSRIVLNEGGVRHFPITMRIFEAVGAGAALLTDPIPGLDLLFDPDREYSTLTGDVVGHVYGLIGELEATQSMAERALSRASRHHTYDHRVDQLVHIARETSKREIRPSPATTDLGRLIERDVEVQRIVHDDIDDLEVELPDREVWPVEERIGRLAPASMDAAVVTSDSSGGVAPLLDSARRYIYARGEVPGLPGYLTARHPDAVVESWGDLQRVDLLAESYRVEAAGRQK